MNEVSRLSTVVPTPLYKAIKVKCIENDRQIQDVVAEALQEWLARQSVAKP